MHSTLFMIFSIVMVAGSLVGCSQGVDLTKTLRATGAGCALDAPVAPEQPSGAPPFTQQTGTLQLNGVPQAVSIATTDGTVWIAARIAGRQLHPLVGLDATGKQVHRWNVPGRPWKLHVLGDRGVYWDLQNDTLVTINLNTGDTEATQPLDAAPVGLVVSVDGSRAYQPLALVGEIAVIDLSSGLEVCRLPTASGVGQAIELSRDGRRIFVGYAGGGGSTYHAGLEVLDRRTGETLGLLETGSPLIDLALSDDERVIAALIGLGENLMLMDPRSLTEVGDVELPGVADGVVWHDGYAYAFGAQANSVWVVDVDDQRVIATIDLPGPPTDIAFGTDAGYVTAGTTAVLER